MSSEAQLILDVWEVVRDAVPHSKRPTVAEDLLRAFREYGFEPLDCATVVDEDPELARAYAEVFSDEIDDEDEEDDDS